MKPKIIENKIREVKFGANVTVYQPVNLYECKVGDNTRISTFVEIQKNAIIGNNCKISSHTFICEGVRIGDGCFIGHGVLFINDKYPTAVNADNSLKTDKDWKLVETIIEDKVSIGSGAVVTKNVEKNTTVVGVPAREKI